VDTGEVVWLPSYFTQVPHAVLNPPGGVWYFRGVPIVWSLCGRAVDATGETKRRQHCVACERLAYRMTAGRGPMTRPPSAEA
jgi:hypothetical protein